jgi:hypothetical protein
MKNSVRISMLLILMFVSIYSFGQDKIFLANGQIIKAKITQVGASDIEYNKFESQDSSGYFVSIKKVTKIIFANGAEQLFQSSSPSTSIETSDKATTSLTSNDVFTTTELAFYGLDFSNFSLIEGKRVKQAEEIKNKYFPAWNTFFEKQIGVEKLKKWLGKADVIYYPEPIANINSMTSLEKTVVADKYGCNTDDMASLIAKSISQYSKVETTCKIGFVINVQYFEKATNETAAYCTFFDIENNALISTKRIIVRKADGSGLTDYWGNSLIYIIKEFVDKAYRKGYL